MEYSLSDTDSENNSDLLLLYDDENNNNNENNENNNNNNGYLTQDEFDVDSMSHNDMDDYSISTEEEEEFDTLFEEESEHLFQEKVDKHYYVGLATQIEGDDFLIMANTISIKGFFKFPYHKLLHYLWLHSIIRVKQPKIDILKLIILPDGIYSVVNKTFWLRVFQRRCKRIFRESQEKLMRMKSLKYLKIREVRGKIPL